MSDRNLQSVVTNMAHQAFDLERGPLLRAAWFHRSARPPVILLVGHHLILDLWSMAQLLSELTALCSRAVASDDPNLPAVGPSYADFVAWEDALVEGPYGEDMWAFWRRRIPDRGEQFDFPIDRPRPSRHIRDGASHPFQIGSRATAHLRAVSQTHGFHGQCVLLSAYAALLSKRTSCERVILGTMASGRTRPEFARIIGHFVNPLLLNLDTSGNPTCSELFRRIHTEILEVFDNQAYPFSLLVKNACPPREPNRSPLFQVMFVYQQLAFDTEWAACVLGHARRPVHANGVALESMPVSHKACRYDLTMYVADSGTCLDGLIVYDAHLFDRDTIVGFTAEFVDLVSIMSADPSQRLADILAAASALDHRPPAPVRLSPKAV